MSIGLCAAFAIFPLSARVQNREMPAAAAPRIETLQHAAALIAQHDLAAAEMSLQALLQQAPDDPLALNLLGVVRMQQHNPDEAAKLFRKAIQTGHEVVGPHINLASIYGVARPLEAIAELKEALTIAPTDREAASLLRQIAKDSALAAVRSSNKDRAMAVLLKAREALPHDPELLYEFGFVAFESGLYRDAEQSLTQALKIQPDYPEATYALARSYLAENLAQPAEEQMRKYLAEKPGDATAQYGLGYVLMAEQRIEEAKAAFQKSLLLQPNQTESLFQLGEIAMQEGQNDAARGAFNKVLARDPHHAGALTEIGVLAFRASKYDEARNALERAIESAPSYQKAHYYYALTLSKLGQQAEAKQEFAIATRLQKEHGAEPHLAAAQP